MLKKVMDFKGFIQIYKGKAPKDGFCLSSPFRSVSWWFSPSCDSHLGIPHWAVMGLFLPLTSTHTLCSLIAVLFYYMYLPAGHMKNTIKYEEYIIFFSLACIGTFIGSRHHDWKVSVMAHLVSQRVSPSARWSWCHRTIRHMLPRCPHHPYKNLAVL